MNRIDINVVSTAGGQWVEHWTPEQLAYFTFLTGHTDPLDAILQAPHGIPYGTNRYRWDPAFVSTEEFERIRDDFPGHHPRSFVREDCEQIMLSLAPGWTWGMTLDPPDDRLLMDKLIDLCVDDMTYEGFSFHTARHIFRSTIDTDKAVTLRDSGHRLRQMIASISAELAEEVRSGRIVGRPLRFGCREPGFRAPLSLWQDL